MLRKRVTWIVAPLLLVVVTGALYWFAPWKLFTNTTVNDTLSLPTDEPRATAREGPATSSATPVARPIVLAQGTFTSHEHDTTGTARIVRDPDGSRHREIVNLATSDGPDLRVWLTDQPAGAADAFDKGRHVELGRLKGNRGNQTYPIPASADLTSHRSVTIWCIRFSVSFGAADLSPPGQ